MITDMKPPLDEELLLHYGIKGMKWGVRGSRATTGLTRHRGALIDRNERYKFQAKKTLRGEKHKIAGGLARKIMGEETFKRRINVQIKELNAQNKRLRAGKLTVEDRLDAVMNVSVAALLISRTPK